LEQLDLFRQPLWSVSELTRYLRDLLESDDLLQDLLVEGEISNVSRPASGHLYFTLKDAGAALKCVMWKTSVARLPFIPKEGMAIEAHGNLSIYETGGQYQLYVDRIRAAGEGMLYQEFLRLKERLEKEGLFDPERKRSIPEYPHKIGIVTSLTGAALQDILDTIRRRWPMVEVYISPTPVQGIEAPAGIISAIGRLNESIHPDVILVARGGGSIEDLWAFNDEHVARAIANSPAPIISGIGHETDFTIADFASDLRAPTPTASAELATPNRIELLAKMAEQNLQLFRAIQSILILARQQLGQRMSTLSVRSPSRQILTERQNLDEVGRRSFVAFTHFLEVRRTLLSGTIQNLASLNPSAVLKRGYAIIKSQAGEYISTILKIEHGMELTIQLQDGEFPATADGKHKTIL
jgi:exodeoxyribonuclease VII large subunit